MTSQFEYSNSPLATQCQGLTLDDADTQFAHEINLDMESYTIHDEPDLVEKVTGVSSIGEYKRVARDIEDLRHNSDTDPRHRALFEKALEWFDSDINEESDKLESRIYPQVKVFIYLTALYVRKKREQSNLPLKRYLLPHSKINEKGDPTTTKRHDMVLRWLDPEPLSVPDGDRDTGVLEECDAFMESIRANNSTSHPATTAGSSQSAMGGYYNMNSKERNEDAIRERFWHCFGIIECKAQYNQNQEIQDYGQLGWYVYAALNALFERNNLWGWIIAGTTIRFVFFTHGAAVSSKLIDMKYQEGRQLFIDSFIRLCLCSPYRAGFDLSKRWLPDEGKWEVDCFHSSDLEETEPVRAYVDPIPFKIQGGLFGRRTRCHKTWLTKGTGDSKGNKDNDVFVLKESWTELNDDPKKPTNMNTESLPKERRVVLRVSLMAGSPDSGKFSTVARYCGDLDIVNKRYNVQLVDPTTVESDTDNDVPSFRHVNRVHQRLLMSPMGESLNKLHSWARKPGNKTPGFDEYEKDTLAINVEAVFARLFWIIYYLYTDLGVYHRDLSEGNVLVCEVDGVPHPLLIDFDHSRLCSDPPNDNMHSCMGTVPFMSILNLAGRSNQLTIVDEPESFLYLWVWKCTVGFSPSQVTTSQQTPASVSERISQRYTTSHQLTLSAQRRKILLDKIDQPLVRLWTKGDPGKACLDAKQRDTVCDTSFQFVLRELQPEFTKLNDFFLELRGALFDWDGQEATYFKETDCRPKKRRQISIPDGIDSGTANQRFMEAMMERYKQKKKNIYS